jgi:DNA mismatch repair protein MutS
VLTHRSFAKGVRLPMAGVPHHHVQAYIAKLIDKGFKVALVEQLEDPKKVKRLVKRDVVRVITPGTVVEDALLKSKSDNYLAAIAYATADHRPRTAEKDLRPSAVGGPRSSFGLAFIDLSTGEFATTQITGADAEAQLLDELERVQASEYVLPGSFAQDENWLARLNAIRPARVSPLPDRAFEEDNARRVLLDHFRVQTLDAFGCEELPLALSAAGAALHYLHTNQPETLAAPGERALAHLNQLWTYSLDAYMTLDAATRRNLELTAPLVSPGPGEGARSARSLWSVLDQTETAMGARLLKRWIHQPLLEVEPIRQRQAAVAELHRDVFLRADLRKLLDGLYDMERLVGRIGFGAANARDLMGLKRALLRIPKIKTRLNDAQSHRLRELNAELDELDDVLHLIDRALVDDPPILIKEGGLIRESYDPALDELRDGAARGKAWLADLEEQERKRTGIKSLRVRYNEVFGFFIEAPRRDAHLIPNDYERRATISHAERYVTRELKAQEANILATQERVQDLEYELFVQVRRAVASQAARLQAAARILAQLDALGALAEAAARYNYVQPEVDAGDGIEIQEGRHPVVERYLREGEVFVPNNAALDRDGQRVLILTGPNMSGKSVFIRQIALIVLLAQIGSFVPARAARIGLTDRIFTRVGASDDIAQGRSTFLVEMSETSHILRHATPQSLVVLDEVGRGTSTYDGISLAWAIAEELHNVVGCKTLFATHYHELTRLVDAPTIAAHGSAVKNFTMAVRERADGVVFLRQVIEGGTEKSFGIHVAQLAGLPGRVIERAAEVLIGLETSRQEADRRPPTTDGRPQADDRPPTADRRPQVAKDRQVDATGGAPSALSDPKRAVVREARELYDARVEAWRTVLRELSDADIANMTPVQALVLLNELQVRVKEFAPAGSE